VIGVDTDQQLEYPESVSYIYKLYRTYKDIKNRNLTCLGCNDRNNIYYFKHERGLVLFTHELSGSKDNNQYYTQADIKSMRL
jgi:hypothetical protein